MQPVLNPPDASRVAEPISNRFVERNSHWLAVFGRLKPGVSREQAGNELTNVARHVGETYEGKVHAETLRSVQLLRMSGGMDPRDQEEALPLAGIGPRPPPVAASPPRAARGRAALAKAQR